MEEVFQYRFRGTYEEFAAQVFFPERNRPLEFDGYQLTRDARGLIQFGLGQAGLDDLHQGAVVIRLIQFGLGQAGHGAGHWYAHTIRQEDGALIFTGRIVRKRHDGTILEDSPFTWKDWLLLMPVAILLSPVLLIAWGYSLFRPEVSESSAQRLDRLMTGRFHCEKL